VSKPRALREEKGAAETAPAMTGKMGEVNTQSHQKQDDIGQKSSIAPALTFYQHD
jgi:hypothetical protein